MSVISNTTLSPALLIVCKGRFSSWLSLAYVNVLGRNEIHYFDLFSALGFKFCKMNICDGISVMNKLQISTVVAFYLALNIETNRLLNYAEITMKMN